VNTTIIRKRDRLVANKERLLMVWTDDQTSCHVLLNQAIVQNKAQNLFGDMKAKERRSRKGCRIWSKSWLARKKNPGHSKERETDRHCKHSPQKKWKVIYR
jgi:hypothetical protein